MRKTLVDTGDSERNFLWREIYSHTHFYNGFENSFRLDALD